jgi:ATP-dependent Lon protease
VLIPKENEKDLAEIPDNVKNGLTIVGVTTVDEVLHRALVRQPQPVEWVEVEARPVPAPAAETGEEPSARLPN